MSTAVVLAVLLSLVGLASPAEARTASRLTVEGPTTTTIDAGATVVLRGSLARARGREKVRMQYWDGDRWQTRAVSRVTTAGRYRLSLVPPLGDRRWRVRFPGDGRSKPASSRVLRVRVRPALAPASIPGERATLSGDLPGHTRRPVHLQQWSGTAWRTIRSSSSSRFGSARFAVTVQRAGAPQGRYRLHAPRSGRLPAFTSRWRTATGAQTARLYTVEKANLEERTEVTAMFTPARPGRPVDVQRFVNGAWTTIATGRQDHAGRIDVSFEADALGEMHLRAVAHRTPRGGEPAVTAARTVTVVDGPIQPPTLVSRSADGPADGSSNGSSVSADGSVVAFTSGASNLVAGDANGRSDVFVRDLASGRIVRASVASDGAELAEPSSRASVSGDGTKVAFVTTAAAVPQDVNGRQDVYVRDLELGTTTLVSGAGDGGAGAPRLSADGSSVVFISNSEDLVEDDANGRADVFLRDLASGRTSLVSLAPDGPALMANSASFAVSGDGRFVVYLVRPGGDAPMRLFRRDLQQGTTVLVGGPAPCGTATPAVSDDGRHIVYVTCANGPDDENGLPDVVRHDLDTGTTAWISRSAYGSRAAAGMAGSPSMSADGRFIAFASDAATLLAADGNGRRDVYVHDGAHDSLQRVSVGRNGREFWYDSEEPSISADGGAVVFSSLAPLHPDDGHPGQDVYLRRIAPMPPF